MRLSRSSRPRVAHPGQSCRQTVDAVASRGATPLVVAENANIAGVIVLEDILKTGMLERFARLRTDGSPNSDDHR